MFSRKKYSLAAVFYRGPTSTFPSKMGQKWWMNNEYSNTKRRKIIIYHKIQIAPSKGRKLRGCSCQNLKKVSCRFYSVKLFRRWIWRGLMFRKKCIKKASIFYEQSKEWTKTTQSLKQPIYEKEALRPLQFIVKCGKKWSSLFSFSDFLVSYCLTFISLRSLGKLINPFII